MDRENVTALTSAGKSDDAALAADLRHRLTQAMEPVIAIMAEARGAGLTLSFSTGLDNFGHLKLVSIDISRPL